MKLFLIILSAIYDLIAYSLYHECVEKDASALEKIFGFVLAAAWPVFIVAMIFLTKKEKKAAVRKESTCK